MEITLEKIELVKDRTGVSYKEAKEALERSKGSVVDAIIEIEENIDKIGQGISQQRVAIAESIKEVVKKGHASKIQVKNAQGEVVLNIPVNVGILGAVVAPWGMLFGSIAAFGCKYIIEVVKDDGTVIDISDKTSDAIEKATEKGSEMYEKMKNSEIYEKVKEKTEETVGKATEAYKSKFAKSQEEEKEEAEKFAEDFDLEEAEKARDIEEIKSDKGEEK